MSKVLFFSDLHAHNYSAFSSTLPNGLNSRFVDCLNIVEQARVVCEEENISHVIFCGDLFHSRTTLAVEVYTETWKAFARLSDELEYLDIVVGNHDQCSRVGDVHSIEAFRRIARVYDTPKAIGYGDFTYLPFVADPNLLKNSLANLPDCKYLIMHQTVREAIPGPDDSLNKPLFCLDDIPWNRISKVISGDIHKRQFLANGKFHYVGSCLQRDFNCVGEEKAFSILDTDSGEIRTVPTEAPRFYEVTPAELVEGLTSSIRRDTDFIKVKCFDEHIAAVNEVRDNYAHLLIERVKNRQQRLRRAGKSIVGNDQELLREYITQQNTTLDAAKLLTIGMSELEIV